MDDTTSLRLVLSSTRYNSPRSEYGVSFPDYAGEYILSLKLIEVLLTSFRRFLSFIKIILSHYLCINLLSVLHLIFLRCKLLSNPYKMPVFFLIIINGAWQLSCDRSQEMNSAEIILESWKIWALKTVRFEISIFN